MVNRASEYVEASRDRSPVHRYVSENGVGVSRVDIEHGEVAGRQVALSADLTAEDRVLVKQAIQTTDPGEKTCYENALRLWLFNDRFVYAEGFAFIADLDFTTSHAWCMLDGEKLVDVTEAFDGYHGALVSDSTVLERYAGTELMTSGIIGNRENRLEFLRERGYTDYE